MRCSWAATIYATVQLIVILGLARAKDPDDEAPYFEDMPNIMFNPLRYFTQHTASEIWILQSKAFLRLQEDLDATYNHAGRSQKLTFNVLAYNVRRDSQNYIPGSDLGLLLGSCSEEAVPPDACLNTGGAYKFLRGAIDADGTAKAAVAFWTPVEEAKRSVITFKQDSDALQLAAEGCYQQYQSRGPRIDLTNLAQCILLGYTLGMEKEYGLPNEYLKAIAVVPRDVTLGHVLKGKLLIADLPSPDNAQYTVYTLL